MIHAELLLGIGTSHQQARSWHGRGYAHPVSDMSEYLDAVDAGYWAGPRPDPPVPRMIAALGPRMLELARRRSRGAIPYLVPVEHTIFARAALDPEPELAVHQAIVIGQPLARAREIAREHVTRYLRAPNYRNNLLRLGFSDVDLAGVGSDRLIDALVAIGDADEVAARVHAHLDAGAVHVCMNPLPQAFDAVPVAQLHALASAV